MEAISFVAFFSLVVAWLAAPTGARVPKPAVSSALRIGEAKA